MHEPIFQSNRTEGSGGLHHMCVRADHPVFEEHFPGFPVVPGSMTVAMILQRIGQTMGGRPRLASASFLNPVRPSDEPVTLKTSRRAGEVRFRLTQGTRTVCRGAVSTGGGADHG